MLLERKGRSICGDLAMKCRYFNVQDKGVQGKQLRGGNGLERGLFFYP